MPRTVINNPRFRRHSIRLPGYDYSASGAYFITICTYQRVCFLGEISDDSSHPSEYGAITRSVWDGIPKHYPNVELDAFVVMPNHIHGIVFLQDAVGAGLRPAPDEAKRSPLFEVMRGFKSFSARQINELRQTPGMSVWQRNYYEHIIRNEQSLNTIRQYILSNPENWSLDEENPSHKRGQGQV